MENQIWDQEKSIQWGVDLPKPGLWEARVSTLRWGPVPLLPTPLEQIWKEPPLTVTVDIWDSEVNMPFTIQGQNPFLALLAEEEIFNLRLNVNSLLNEPEQCKLFATCLWVGIDWDKGGTVEQLHIHK